MPYSSEFSQFIQALKQQNPEIERRQQLGRALLWDKKPINMQERREFNSAKIKQTSYVYYEKF